jgi:hypothetical protein
MAVLPIRSILDFESYILSFAGQQSLNGVVIYPPRIDDLYSLYSTVRMKKSIAILEFGSGWSTLALTLALDENKSSYENYVNSHIRHPNAYSLMSVDCSSEFQSIALDRIQKPLNPDLVIPIISSARMTVLNGQACHIYDEIPPFTADFIYLDGPDCNQVGGDVNGMSVRFGSPEYMYGLPMSGDLLVLEPFIWPGTVIVTDGRGANAYFLKNNFRRKWDYHYDSRVDQHTFELLDDPWGGISEALIKFRNLPT